MGEFVKHDQDKPATHLLPPRALIEVAKVLGHGARKYPPNNWRQCPAGEARDRYGGAAMRHLLALMNGEWLDQDSGLPHAAHLACCALFLTEFGPGVVQASAIPDLDGVEEDEVEDEDGVEEDMEDEDEDAEDEVQHCVCCDHYEPPRQHVSARSITPAKPPPPPPPRSQDARDWLRFVDARQVPSVLDTLFPGLEWHFQPCTIVGVRPGWGSVAITMTSTAEKWSVKLRSVDMTYTWASIAPAADTLEAAVSFTLGCASRAHAGWHELEDVLRHAPGKLRTPTQVFKSYQDASTVPALLTTKFPHLAWDKITPPYRWIGVAPDGARIEVSLTDSGVWHCTARRGPNDSLCFIRDGGGNAGLEDTIRALIVDNQNEPEYLRIPSLFPPEPVTAPTSTKPEAPPPPAAPPQTREEDLRDALRQRYRHLSWSAEDGCVRGWCEGALRLVLRRNSKSWTITHHNPPLPPYTQDTGEWDGVTALADIAERHMALATLLHTPTEPTAEPAPTPAATATDTLLAVLRAKFPRLTWRAPSVPDPRGAAIGSDGETSLLSVGWGPGDDLKRSMTYVTTLGHRSTLDFLDRGLDHLLDVVGSLRNRDAAPRLRELLAPAGS